MVDYDAGEHVFDYSQHLPYDVPQHEASNWLRLIRTQLTGHLVVGDWSGCIRWTESLKSYMRFKYPVDRASRADLVTLLYALITSETSSSDAIDAWCDLLINLAHHIHRLDPADLTLPWKPLYEQMQRCLIPKRRNRGFLFKKAMGSPLSRIPGVVSRFFPVGTTQEVLDEFLPQFCFQDLDLTETTLQWLCQFLPLTLDSARIFLPEVFSLWPKVTHSDSWDVDWMDAIARLATRVGIHSVELGLTHGERHTIIIDAIYRSFRVPVGDMPGRGLFSEVNTTRECDAPLVGRIVDRASVSAHFIVATIVPGESATLGKGGSLSRLQDFLRAHETFFHPSNFGSWTSALFQFLERICAHLFSRLKRERTGKIPVPDGWRIEHSGDLQVIAEWIQPLAYLGLFGKDAKVTRQCQSIFRYLMYFAPATIAPPLLAHSYQALSGEALSETHRTLAVLGALSTCARPLFSRSHYPEGARHMMPLLSLALPGLDANDAGKTQAAALFIAATAVGVRFEDLSELPPFSRPGERDQEESEEDQACRLSTGEMGGWLNEFFGRVWAILENVSDREEGAHSDLQSNAVLYTLRSSLPIIMAQCSPDILRMLRNVVFAWVEDTILARDTLNDVGNLCGILTREEGGGRFVDLCINRIGEELDGGAGLDRGSKGRRRERSLLWFANILKYVLTMVKDPEGTLPWKDQTESILLRMLQACRSRESVLASSDLLSFWIQQLIGTDVVEAYAITGKDNVKEHHRHWHTSMTEAERDGISLGWRSPTDRSISQTDHLVDILLIPAIEGIEGILGPLASLPTGDSKDELVADLERYTQWLKPSLRVLGTLIPDDLESERGSTVGVSGEPLLFTAEGAGIPAPFLSRLFALRTRVTKAMNEALMLLGSHFPGEVHAFQLLCSLAGDLILDRGVRMYEMDTHLAMQAYRKSSWTGAGDTSGKCASRYILAHAIRLYHLRRITYNTCRQPWCEWKSGVVQALLHVSTSDYAVVRGYAATALKRIVDYQPLWRSNVIQGALAVVEGYAPGQDERVEGALRLLSGITPCAEACGKDWRYVGRWVRAFFGLEAEEKSQFQSLVNAAYRVLDGYIPHIGIIRRLDLDQPGNFSAHTIATWLGRQDMAAVDVRAIKEAAGEKVARRIATESKERPELIAYLHAHWALGRSGWRYARRGLDLYGRIGVDARAGVLAPAEAISLMIADSLVSDVTWIRQAGGQLLEKALLILKDRWSQQGQATRWIVDGVKDRGDEETEQYILAGVGMAMSEGPDTTLLQDKVYTGWYRWPSYGYKAYQPDWCAEENAEYVFPPAESKDAKALLSLRTLLASPSWWRIYMRLHAQEAEGDVSKGGGSSENFSRRNARFYSMIAKTLGPSVGLSCMLPAILDVGGTPAILEGQHQKVVSEMLAGLLRGCKHWSATSRASLWERSMPLLARAFVPGAAADLLTPETYRYWVSLLRFVVIDRDPRRAMPLLDLVLEGTAMDLDTEAGFMETCKLFYRRLLSSILHWRIAPKLQAVGAVTEGWGALNHPYLQVRRALGDTLCSYSLMEAGRIGVVGPERKRGMEEKAGGRAKKLRTRLGTLQAQSHPVAEGPSDYRRVAQTVHQWLHKSLAHPIPPPTAAMLPPLLSSLLLILDQSDDADLHAMTLRSISDIARFPYPDPVSVEVIVHLLVLGGGSTSGSDDSGSSFGSGSENPLTAHAMWHIRDKTLQMLQVLVFRKFVFLSADLRNAVLHRVAAMLEDPQVEVRQRASETLSGLIRCCPDREENEDGEEEEGHGSILRLRDGFARTLAKTTIPVRGKKDASPAVADARLKAIQKRHAAILGLSCLISAFPYEVPEWMPSTLVRIADGINDCEPIQSTVRATFSSFKRTHQDTWVLDREKFSEDELMLLADLLVSPSYYV